VSAIASPLDPQTLALRVSQYQPVIGLEIHAQLASKAKIFAPDPVDFGGQPNTRVSPITLAHPGILPTINKTCVEMAIRMGLATQSNIRSACHFARKNYFYADIPKGYQITQDDTPICYNGKITIRLANGQTKDIRLERIHLEEDSGKSYHDQDLYDSLIDFNRAGTGLIEIVSKPDIENAEQAMAFIQEVRKLVRYLEICDGNMEEGSLRCDVNVSVMKRDATEYGTRVEVKNLNSISNVGKAIFYEIDRQVQAIESGDRVYKETRTWDAGTGTTILMRDKEDSSDYRYFPEPDLQPVLISAEWLQSIQERMPTLPEALFIRYTTELGLPAHDAALLTEQKEFAQYFEAILALVPTPKLVSNWLNGSVKSYLNQLAIDISQFPLSAASLASLIQLVENDQVSLSAARDQLFPALAASPERPAIELAQEMNLILENDTDSILQAIEAVLNDNPDKVETYLKGKTGLLGFFVGQVAKLTGGKADPKIIHALLTQQLSQRQ
jgi:aspartyl-tRNA(Asn)/glutamyl-tRNA(Gln) amidotransferase subunit B